MRSSKFVRCFALVALLFTTLNGATYCDDVATRQITALSGKLRTALYLGIPTSILRTGSAEPRSVSYEIGMALARKLRVPYESVRSRPTA